MLYQNLMCSSACFTFKLKKQLLCIHKIVDNFLRLYESINHQLRLEIIRLFKVIRQICLQLFN